jgi:hypothetical protein
MESCLRTGDSATVCGIDQRKALAVKLVLGLMLSMDSDHIIDTWNPKRIQFLKPMDTEFTPFISIYESGNSSSHRNSLSLAKLDICGDGGNDDDDDDDDDARPLPPFTLLAKLLLHIARGERLKTIKIDCAPEKAFNDGWKALRRMIEVYIKKVTCGREVDRETLPFLHAARNCLEFHMRYQVRVKSERSNHRMETAWRLVFDDIIAQIDNKLNLGQLVQPGTDASTKEAHMPVADQTVVGESSIAAVVSLARDPLDTAAVIENLNEEFSDRSVETATTQPEVALFDGENAKEDST